MANVSCGTSLCSTTTCSTGAANTTCETPVPVYPSGPASSSNPCQENHCLEIRTNLYGAALETGLQFNIPACGQSAVVYVAGLTLAHVGSYLWSSIYGYYEIIAYNASTAEVTIKNNCTNGNSAAGTSVPKCSAFVVSPAPIEESGDIAYLAADFVTPIVTGCVAITVTDTSNIVAGNIVTIASGTYTVQSITNGTSMVICNDGLGQTPGTTITAISGTGGFNYPIILEDASSVLSDQDQLLNVDLDSGNLTQTITVNISYTNTSSSRNANMFYTANSYYSGTTLDAFTDVVEYQMLIELSIDGGAFVTVNDQSDSQYDVDDTAHSISKEMNYGSVEVVAPLATRTVAVRTTLNWLGTGTAKIDIDAFVCSMSAITAF